MSYRLIDANLVAESYAEANDMPCIYADLPRGLDGGHYDMREMNELHTENAKLRMRVVSLESALEGMHLIRDQDKAENAKLRKLARDMRQTIDGMQEQSNSGSGYVLCADVCPRWEVECSKQPPDVCWYELRMRELGVEAKE